MTKRLCNALPLKGDGSAPCTLEAFHKGLHEHDGTVAHVRVRLRFRKIEPGSSPRSPDRSRKRLFTKILRGEV